MSRKAATTEIEVGDVTPPKEPTTASNTANLIKEEGTEAERKEFVSREEHDEAVKSLRNEISDLKEQVADLSNVVTAPQGAVHFYDVVPGDPEQGGYGEPNVPDYSSAGRGDGSVPWY